MKYFLTVLFILSALICFSQKKIDKERCPTIYKNNFKRIQIETFESIVGKDTLLLTELKYECTYSALDTHKLMFDKFGKWHKSVSHPGETTLSLIWENVQLFPENSKKYTVITSGEESWKYIYSGVTVLDESGKDVLAENSPEQQKLIEYFKKLIRKNKEKNKSFYEVYSTLKDEKDFRIPK